MNTISSMETRGLPFHDPSGSFPICVLQAQVLTPICIDDTHVTQMPPPEKKFFAISGGARFTCGLDYGSRFPLCWGKLQVPALLQNVSYTSLSSGANHCCAIRSNDSRVDCWGEELAIALLEDESLVSVSSGVDFSCGVTQGGEVLCWGYVPDQVPQPKNEIFTSVFVGGYTICGVTSSTGETLCWGQDSSAFVVPAGYKFSRLAGGYHHMCGIRSDNHQVVCWGLNKAQQLQVPRDATFSAISAGDIYTCGVTRDANARLLCWGNNAVQYREIDLHVSQAVCTNECGKNQYRVNRTSSPQQCPSLSDKVCLECSACVGVDFEISPCGADSDRKCGMIIGKNNLPASFKGPGRRNPTGLFFIMLPLVVTSSLGITLIGVWACQEYRERLVSNKQRLRK
ncbi:putative receptor protein kinase CRINKLY4 [Selaginella moellendorffii]|uniref:putative receptor protein kinase CRINKLY4 n=1 Tax=Selaginella moellendorffii TaxID=88036 RepID=UPI000D1CE206|nr:putative receptor protein kinase CRINKLY4 [Selaginella moellendorffii]|eukprot:XP_024537353.1 putative receptor protein kinase CRINKLY4 [Selaginella moellendorffii]